MQVVVKRSALFTALKNIISENRTGESGRIDDIMRDAAMGEEPIEATEQMATQLSVDMPDVSDVDFVPATIEQLSRSAYVIANAVPPDEVEWFYRMLHDMLDQSLDRDSKVSEEEVEEIEVEINESIVNKVISLLLEQDDEWTDDELDRIEVAKHQVEEYLESINFGHSEKEMPSGKVLNLPFWQAIMKLSLDDTIGPKSLDPKIAEIILDLSSEEAERVLDIIRETWMGYARIPVPKQDPNQIAVRQVLAKELDVLLTQYTYWDIIDIYEKRLSDESTSPEWFQDRLKHKDGEMWRVGTRGMIDTVKTRIRSPEKRERTDFTVKSGHYREDTGDDEDIATSSGMSEEERLKTLDSLAPLFGFRNASGLRQWRMKFPEAIFKSVIGSEGGIKAYEGYSDVVFDYLSALLDNLSDAVAQVSENLEDAAEKDPDNEDISETLKALQQIDIDLVEIKEKRDNDPEEALDTTMLLTTLGGKVLRQVFSTYFYRNEFIDYAREMMKHMTASIAGMGVNSKTAKGFAKMFNGEVALQLFNSGARQMEKLKAGGITSEIYTQSLSVAERFNKDFFGGKRLKDVKATFMKLLKDDAKLQKALLHAIPDALSWGKIERENPQLKVQSPEDLAEQKIRKLISGMI